MADGLAPSKAASGNSHLRVEAQSFWPGAEEFKMPSSLRSVRTRGYANVEALDQIPFTPSQGIISPSTNRFSARGYDGSFYFSSTPRPPRTAAELHMQDMAVHSPHHLAAQNAFLFPSPFSPPAQPQEAVTAPGMGGNHANHASMANAPYPGFGLVPVFGPVYGHQGPFVSANPPRQRSRLGPTSQGEGSSSSYASSAYFAIPHVDYGFGQMVPMAMYDMQSAWPNFVHVDGSPPQPPTPTREQPGAFRQGRQRRHSSMTRASSSQTPGSFERAASSSALSDTGSKAGPTTAQLGSLTDPPMNARRRRTLRRAQERERLAREREEQERSQNELEGEPHRAESTLQAKEEAESNNPEES